MGIDYTDRQRNSRHPLGRGPRTQRYGVTPSGHEHLRSRNRAADYYLERLRVERLVEEEAERTVYFYRDKRRRTIARERERQRLEELGLDIPAALLVEKAAVR